MTLIKIAKISPKSLVVRRDFFRIGVIIFIFLLMFIWQELDEPFIKKYIYSILSVYVPLACLIIFTPFPRKAKKSLSVTKNRIYKKHSWLDTSVTFFNFMIISLSYVLGDTNLLIVGVVASAITILFQQYRTGRLKKIITFLSRTYCNKGIEPYLLGIASVFSTLILTELFKKTLPDFFQFHWKPFPNTNGNFIIEPIISTVNNGWSLVGVVIALVIFITIPYFAGEEEKFFRYRRFSIDEIVSGSILFGLIHVFSGIPVYACFALIFSGVLYSFYYKYNYSKLTKKYPLNPKRNSLQALSWSTAIHSIHNSLIIIVIVLMVLM